MYNILVCDDEKDIVSALHIYLSAEGYRVLTAFDGPEACGCWTGRRYTWCCWM